MNLAEEAASNLAEEIQNGLDHSGLILYRNIADGTPTSVFVSETGDEMLATLASAIDDNPLLIVLLISALRMVKMEGQNAGDPGFAGVIFAGEGVKH